MKRTRWLQLIDLAHTHGKFQLCLLFQNILAKLWENNFFEGKLFIKFWQSFLILFWCFFFLVLSLERGDFLLFEQFSKNMLPINAKSLLGRSTLVLHHKKWIKKKNLNISTTKKRNNHVHSYLEKNYETMFLLLVWSCKYSSPLSLTFQTLVQSTSLDARHECSWMQGPSKHESYNTN
jgi:hypothetical protein